MSDDNETRIDFDNLASYLRIDKKMLIDLVKEFINSFNDYLLEFQTGLKDKDYKMIASTAHRLKGTALELHLDKLVDQAAEIESNAKNNNDINYNQLIEQISFTIQQIQTQL